MEGIELLHDPYEIFGSNELLRKAVKIMLLAAINAETTQDTLKGFNYQLNRPRHDWEQRKTFDSIKMELALQSISNADLLQKIADTHPQISKYFCSGKGLELQNKDSVIATDILNHFTSLSIPCLCVHDSFIVPYNSASALKTLMEESYKKHMKFNCQVEVKSNVLSNNVEVKK